MFLVVAVRFLVVILLWVVGVGDLVACCVGCLTCCLIIVMVCVGLFDVVVWGIVCLGVLLGLGVVVSVVTSVYIWC